MKKTTKYILLTLAVLLVLGGACAALLLTDPAQSADAETTPTPTPGTSLLARDLAELTSVDIQNPQGEFTLLVSEKPAEAASAASAEEGASSTATPVEKAYTYAVQGYEAYSIKESTFDTAVKGLCALTSTKDLGEQADLKSFGLSGKEATKVTLQFANGAQEEITVGKAAGETAGNYVLHGGKVYIASVNTAFTTGMYPNFEGFGYSIADVDDGSGMGAYSTLEQLSLSGTQFEEPIEMLYNEEKAEFRMSTPVNTDCNIAAIEELTTALKTLSGTAVVKAKATAADLKTYGLDKPYAAVSFTINGESHQIAVSEKKVDGQRYMLAEGKTDIVYTVGADTVAPWTDTTAFKLRNTYVFLPMIMNVDDFTIEAGTKKLTVDLSRTKNDEKSSETQTVYDYVATKNGKDVVYEDVTKFYMSLISIAALNDDRLEYGNDPAVKITFNYYEGGKDVLEYRAAGEDRLVALLNGEYSATVRKTSVDDFIASLEAFLVAE